jgi:GDP-mannose 6-dehydrogenase
MNISIIGLGYVGAVSAACFAKIGNHVIGVDINNLKVDMINNGKCPIVEKDLDKIIQNMVNNGRLSATSELNEAISKTDLAMICVGTPDKNDGGIDLSAIVRISEDIGKALKKKQDYFVIVIRSTVLPGTINNQIIPILERESGKKLGVDFGICMNPEFLREGTSVYDFYNPPKIVIGEYDDKSGEPLIDLYKQIEAPLVRTGLKKAEMVKYADNAFHALKVTFANEIGNICKKLTIDSHAVMDIFCMDNKLNLSPYYLKPGFAFGGSCLPKDLRAITNLARDMGIKTHVMDSILESNEYQIKKVVDKLTEYKGRKLGFCGLSFKHGTDDLRESPLVKVIETMLGKGFKIKVYDNNVSIAKLMGANKDYIETEIPHIASLICSSNMELIKDSEIIIIGNNEDKFRKDLKYINENQVVIDLVRIVDTSADIKGEYYGICW